MEAFFLVEEHESGSLPDLFVRLTTPFREPARYGLELVDALSAHHEAVRGELLEAGADASWRAPRQPRGRDSVGALVDAAASFHAHHQPLFRHLVLVLLPESVSSPREWAQWLEQAVQRLEPAGVRLVCFDDPDGLMLAGLARTQARRVRTHVPQLDMGRTLEEVSTMAGGLDTPAGRYRHLFVQLGRAIKAKDLPRASELASEAVQLAQQQGWGHLVIATWFALGSGYFAVKDNVAAIRTYRQAESAAADAHARQEAYGLGLLLKARLALGTALIMAAAHVRAATVYEGAAPLAEQLGDPRMLMECWRMAAYCHEFARAHDASWDCGLKALAVAQKLDDETRRTSTLSYVGEGLLRLTRTGKYRHHGPAIEQQMKKLLGPDWRPVAPRGTTS
jgi:hypothetical protein